MKKSEESKDTTYRIPGDLHAKLVELSGRLATKPNPLAVEMIRDLIRMSEIPEAERVMPKTVRMIDAVSETAGKLLRKAKKEGEQ